MLEMYFFRFWFCFSPQAPAYLNSGKLQRLPTTLWQYAHNSINYQRYNYRTNQKQLYWIQAFLQLKVHVWHLKIHRSIPIHMLLTQFCWKAKMKEKLLKTEKFMTSWCISCQHRQVSRYGHGTGRHPASPWVQLISAWYTELFPVGVM